MWPEVEGGLAKAGVETISIWSDPKDDCSLFMCLGFDPTFHVAGARDPEKSWVGNGRCCLLFFSFSKEGVLRFHVGSFCYSCALVAGRCFRKEMDPTLTLKDGRCW